MSYRQAYNTVGEKAPAYHMGQKPMAYEELSRLMSKPSELEADELKPGSYLYLHITDGWDVYYRILKINKKSLTISTAIGNDEIPQGAIIHPLRQVSWEGSGNRGKVTVADYAKHTVYMAG